MGASESIYRARGVESSSAESEGQAAHAPHASGLRSCRELAISGPRERAPLLRGLGSSEPRETKLVALLRSLEPLSSGLGVLNATTKTAIWTRGAQKPSLRSKPFSTSSRSLTKATRFPSTQPGALALA